MGRPSPAQLEWLYLSEAGLIERQAISEGEPSPPITYSRFSHAALARLRRALPDTTIVE